MSVPPDSEEYCIIDSRGNPVPEGDGFPNEETALAWAQGKGVAYPGTLYVVRETRVVTQVVSQQVTVVTQTAADARAGQVV